MFNFFTRVADFQVALRALTEVFDLFSSGDERLTSHRVI